jgi:plastocyanin
MKQLISTLITATYVAFFASSAVAAEQFTIVIKDHKFSPEVLEVPSGKKIKLTVDNQDPTPEEFESHDLMREKIINGNSKGIVFIGPLEPGEYSYFGEFNMDSALGTIIAK